METKDVDRNINSLLQNEHVLESLRIQQTVIDAIHQCGKGMVEYYGPETAEKWIDEISDSCKPLEDVLSKHIGNVIFEHLCTL